MNTHIQDALYNILFEHPLFDYCDPEKKQFNVLISVDDADVEDGVKIIWYCAQMPKDYHFHFYVHNGNTQTIDNLKTCFKEAASKKFVLPPAIDSLSFEDSCLKSTLAKADLNYMIIANDAAHQNLIKEIRTLNKNSSISTFACAVDFETSAYNCISDNPNAEQNPIWQFNSEDLLRFARNIDFAYALSGDDKCKRRSLNEFKALKTSSKAEDRTAYESSVPAAVHVPYKIKIAGTIDFNHLEEEILYALYYLEHQRWLIYQHCTDWRMPTDDEIIAYAFTESNENHKNNAEKLHPCMCLRNKGKCRLEQYPTLWNEIKAAGYLNREDIRFYVDQHYSGNGLSELDILSLQIHAIACNRIEENQEQLTNTEKILNSLIVKVPENQKPLLHNLKKRWEDLKSGNVERAVSSFERIIQEVKSIFEDRKDNLKMLESIETAAKIYTRANKKTDYEKIDTDLVDMLPFVLNYGKHFRTAVVFSDGEPLFDCMIPSILIPETAIFVLAEDAHDKDETKKYRTIVTDYFKERGEKTKATFETIPCFDLNNMCRFLYQLLCQEINAPFIVNHAKSPEVPYGIMAANRELNIDPPLPVVSFSEGDHHPKIINLPEGTTEIAGITSLKENGYTVEECIQLSGGQINNYIHQKSIYLTDLEHQNLRNLLEKTTEPSGNQMFFWTFMCKRFQDVLKSEKIPPENDNRISDYQGYKCDNSLQEQLEKLKKFKIIIDLNTNTDGSYYFKYKNNGIKIALDKCKSNPNLIFEFSPRFQNDGKIAVCPLSINKNTLLDNCDKEIEKKHPEKSTIHKWLATEDTTKENFFDKLHTAGLINLSNDDINPRFPELLIIEGKAFEMVLYNRLKNTGFFSDLITNVEISWKALHASFEERMQTLFENDSWGYDYFKRCRQTLREESEPLKGNPDISNEIDIISVDRFTPIFFSCKSSNKINKSWIYEVEAISRHFNGKGVLAINKSIFSKDFLATAELHRISLLTRDDIFKTTDEGFKEKINGILNA